MENSNNVKKSLMFATGDDLYFVTYNILLMLKVLKCNGNPRKFTDFKKIAFLISFISNDNLISIVNSDFTLLSKPDHLLLSKAYSDGLMRISQVKKVVLPLPFSPSKMLIPLFRVGV